jgi:hypothetical protein
MSFTSCPCCVAVLNQQQEQNKYYNNPSDDTCVDESTKPVKTCTVVENGRVVVKQVQPSDEK